MANLGLMRQRVYLRLAESAGATFTDAEVDICLNAEYEHLQTLINMKTDEYYMKEVFTTSNEDGDNGTVSTHTFPTDFVKLIDISRQRIGELSAWDPIPKVSVVRREGVKTKRSWYYNDSSSFYYIIGNQYFIAPTPGIGPTNNIRFLYIYVPLLLTSDTDTPIFPPGYHELIDIGAVNRLRKAVKEPPIDEGEYQNRIINLLETITPRVKKQPIQVRMVPGGSY